jgi:hypothetical protein
MLRIIFDRSAFHGHRFELLRSGPLLDLCRSGKVSVLHTGTFLTETLALYGRKERRAELKEQFEFLKAICNGGVFRDSVDIWQDELLRNQSLSTPLLLARGEEERVWARALKGIQKHVWSAWNETAADRQKQHEKKKAQRAIYSSIRKGLPEMIRQKYPGIPLSSYSFEEHRSNAMDAMGKAIIESQFNLPVDTPIYRYWSREKDGYPYFTAFVEGLVYAGYYAAIKQNAAIDDNSQADFELLTYLNHADIVVSSDTKFFRSAFEAIWAPRRKRLVAPEDLASLC